MPQIYVTLSRVENIAYSFIPDSRVSVCFRYSRWKLWLLLKGIGIATAVYLSPFVRRRRISDI